MHQAALWQSEDEVQMLATKPILKGEEIFNDYGEMPSSDLLRRYGYVTERYKKHDVVEISAEYIAKISGHGPPLSKQTVQYTVIVGDHNIVNDGTDLLAS